MPFIQGNKALASLWLVALQISVIVATTTQVLDDHSPIDQTERYNPEAAKRQIGMLIEQGLCFADTSLRIAKDGMAAVKEMLTRVKPDPTVTSTSGPSGPSGP